MTPQQIADRLTAIHSALVEKIGAQPWVAPSLEVRPSGACHIAIYGILKEHGASALAHLDAPTFEEVLDKADAFVASLPSPEEAGIRRYMEQVAKTIDVGREENIPDEYVVPFREVQKAMTDNLLPAPKAGVA
jgi:hypothetical protein